MAKLALLGGKQVIPAPAKKKNVFGPHEKFTEEFTAYCGCKYARCFSWGAHH